MTSDVNESTRLEMNRVIKAPNSTRPAIISLKYGHDYLGDSRTRLDMNRVKKLRFVHISKNDLTLVMSYGKHCCCCYIAVLSSEEETVARL